MARSGRRPICAAGAVGVVVADLAVGRVVVEHRVHVAGADGEAEPRPAERPPGVARVPVGLAEDGHAKALGLQHPAQQGHGEARMIDVGVAGDEHHVDGVPAARGHLGRRHRQRRERAAGGAFVDIDVIVRHGRRSVRPQTGDGGDCRNELDRMETSPTISSVTSARTVTIRLRCDYNVAR